MNYYKNLEWDKAYRKGKRHFDYFSDIYLYAEKMYEATSKKTSEVHISDHTVGNEFLLIYFELN